MAAITPDAIRHEAEKAYRKYLKQWIAGSDEGFFPYSFGAGFTRKAEQLSSEIAAHQRLVAKSKSKLGWGYEIEYQRVDSRQQGDNDFPMKIVIESLADLLKLARKETHFEQTQCVASKISTQLPALVPWQQKRVLRLADYDQHCDDLITVARFFLDHPMPDCYGRQIHVQAGTKFLEIKGIKKVLREWFDLLPGIEAMNHETKFEHRFGLRDKIVHRAVRLLDQALLGELRFPFDELSLPLRSIAQMEVENCTVFISENDLTIFTMPCFERGIVMRGEGNSVIRLKQVKWLAKNRVIYWGDVDTYGFAILSRLRNFFPRVESLMMDMQVLESQERFVKCVEGTPPATPTNLQPHELEAFNYCLQNNKRLEQEYIPQDYVDQAVARL